MPYNFYEDPTFDPWLDEQHESDWIRIATAMSGNNRGSCFMPEKDDEDTPQVPK